MSDFLKEVAADCVEAESDLGEKTMVWMQLHYPVASTLLRRGSVLVVGGREVTITMTLRVRYAGIRNGATWEFVVLPKSGERVNYGGKDYRIAQVNNAHSAFLELDLMDVHR